jgi:iron complex outermembrane receptor protein
MIGVQTSMNGDFSQSILALNTERTKLHPIRYGMFRQTIPSILEKLNAVFQVGAENLFNEYYSTYADWKYTSHG